MNKENDLSDVVKTVTDSLAYFYRYGIDYYIDFLLLFIIVIIVITIISFSLR